MLRRHRPTSAFYTVRPIDNNSRVQSQGIVDLVRWAPGVRVWWQYRDGLILATRLEHGAADIPGETTSVSPKGHLRIPARVRHAARLAIGDRVLVSGGLVPDIVVVLPMLTLDEVLLAHFGTSDAECRS